MAHNHFHRQDPDLLNVQRMISVTAILILAFALAIPLYTAHADVGPKTSMDFEFFGDDGEPLVALTIVSGQQFECSDSDCLDAHALEQVGPQGFNCDANHCSSLAYGYSDYHRLRVRFSDGVERQSNVFSKQAFAARYRVTVQANDLLVEEVNSSGVSFIPSFLTAVPFGAALGLICMAGLVIMPMLVLLGIITVREGAGRSGYPDLRVVYILAWVLGLALVAAMSFESLALAVTVAIEGVLVLVYTAWQKKPMAGLFTTVLYLNLFTHPTLELAMNSLAPNGSWLVLLLAEVVVWLVEAGVLLLAQRKTISARHALLLSLVLNAASFLGGLALVVR
ncbi:MAG: hypothetical protein EHM70_13655 [Chloroflexota bacterium]|nr:MAG: hypothetical protein EHM70_13655 [Chloroflexota bacterium]